MRTTDLARLEPEVGAAGAAAEVAELPAPGVGRPGDAAHGREEAIAGRLAELRVEEDPDHVAVVLVAEQKDVDCHEPFLPSMNCGSGRIRARGGQRQAISRDGATPCSTAQAAIWARETTPSLLRMFWTWVSAVRSAITSMSAIS